MQSISVWKTCFKIKALEKNLSLLQPTYWYTFIQENVISVYKYKNTKRKQTIYMYLQKKCNTKQYLA